MHCFTQRYNTHMPAQVCQWFATRSDLILLLFDPHKLDISDEFKSVIASMSGNEDKLRICLNKADTMEQQQLLRVYGALLWSLGKVVRSPEVARVYVGSFNGGAPVRTDVNPHGEALFQAEQNDLLEVCCCQFCTWQSASASVSVWGVAHGRARLLVYLCGCWL